MIEEDTYAVGYVKSALEYKHTPSICPAGTGGFSYLNKLGLFHINSLKDTKPIEQIDFTTFGAEANAKLRCTFIGADAKLFLAEGSVSIFDLQLGLGVSSEVRG